MTIALEPNSWTHCSSRVNAPSSSAPSSRSAAPVRCRADPPHLTHHGLSLVGELLPRASAGPGGRAWRRSHVRTQPVCSLARTAGVPDPLRAWTELSKCARLTNVVTVSSRMAVRVSPGGAAVGGHPRGDGVAPGQLRHDLAPLVSDDVLSDRRRLQQVGGARRLGSGLQRPGPSHPPAWLAHSLADEPLRPIRRPPSRPVRKPATRPRSPPTARADETVRESFETVAPWTA